MVADDQEEEEKPQVENVATNEMKLYDSAFLTHKKMRKNDNVLNSAPKVRSVHIAIGPFTLNIYVYVTRENRVQILSHFLP